jgi:hypothetical protein
MRRQGQADQTRTPPMQRRASPRHSRARARVPLGLSRRFRRGSAWSPYRQRRRAGRRRQRCCTTAGRCHQSPEAPATFCSRFSRHLAVSPICLERGHHRIDRRAVQSSLYANHRIVSATMRLSRRTRLRMLIKRIRLGLTPSNGRLTLIPAGLERPHSEQSPGVEAFS